jgi:hypothetical protein
LVKNGIGGTNGWIGNDKSWLSVKEIHGQISLAYGSIQSNPF